MLVPTCFVFCSQLNPSVLQLLDFAPLQYLPSLLASISRAFTCYIEKETTKGKALGGGRYRCFISRGGCLLDIYAPMIYTAYCVMFLMRADLLRGQVGVGWALEIKAFLGPVKWHRADRRVPFGAQKTLDLTGCRGVS